jgi:lipoyl-dependent peroxiredoxin subunit D
MSIGDKIDQFLTTNFGENESAVFRDLTLNFKKIMEESPLDPTDRWRNSLAIAQTLNWSGFVQLASTELKELGLEENHIKEAKESAAIMGMLNTYYKFKGFLSADVLADSAYQRAGLRMNSLSKPANGKDKFEMMAFSVSVVNGCPTCVSSHEKALTDIGVTRDQIHELARLASVMKGLSVLTH